MTSIASNVTITVGKGDKARVVSPTSLRSLTKAAQPVVEQRAQVREDDPTTAYFRACAGADWHYSYSDDSSMYKRGLAEIEGLEAQAKTNTTFQAIFDAWKAHKYKSAERPTLEALTTIAEEATPMSDHTSPCGNTACTDTECQARALIRTDLMENHSEQDRIKYGDAIIAALHNLLNDPDHATEGPEFFATFAVDQGKRDVAEGYVAPKPVTLTASTPVIVPDAPAKIRRPRVAKQQPRTTDGQEHPVVVTNKAQEATVSKTYTQADLDRAVRTALAAAEAEREATIRAAKATQPAPEDRPITMVGHKGPNMVVTRGDANREGKGIVLPAIVVDNTLTIDALDLGDLTLDTIVVPATRKPYNQAIHRLLGQPALAQGCTYRNLVEIHKALLEKAQAKAGAKVTERQAKVVEQAAAVAAAPVTNKTHVWKGKPVTAKQHAYYTRNQQPVAEPVQVAVEVTVDKAAKAERKAQVRALMTHLGISKAEAKDLLSK